MSAQPAALSIETLRRFSPFHLLDDPLLTTFASYCQVCRLTAGNKLFSVGDQDSNDYYLLAGKVQLTNAHGRNSFIEAGLPNSNHPLSRSRPRQQTAIANGDIIYFFINSAVLAEINRTTQKSNDYLSIMGMGKPIDDGDALLHQFQHDLSRGNFSLPSFPDVALKITSLIEDPDCNINDVVKLIHRDPAIAAKIIQTANSALYRGVSNCDNINQAVMRLGLMTTKQLVISFSLLGLFESESATLKQHMTLLRRKSVQVAALNAVLAKYFLQLNSEQAMLAGLLHQLGDIVVLSYTERFHEFDQNPMQLALVLNRLSGPAGALAVQEWHFPAPLIEVVKQSSNWLATSSENFSYTDLTLLSKYLCLMPSMTPIKLCNKSSLPALKKALKSQSINALEDILNDSQQILGDIQALLG